MTHTRSHADFGVDQPAVSRGLWRSEKVVSHPVSPTIFRSFFLNKGNRSGIPGLSEADADSLVAIASRYTGQLPISRGQLMDDLRRIRQSADRCLSQR